MIFTELHSYRQAINSISAADFEHISQSIPKQKDRTDNKKSHLEQQGGNRNQETDQHGYNAPQSSELSVIKDVSNRQPVDHLDHNAPSAQEVPLDIQPISNQESLNTIQEPPTANTDRVFTSGDQSFQEQASQKKHQSSLRFGPEQITNSTVHNDSERRPSNSRPIDNTELNGPIPDDDNAILIKNAVEDDVIVLKPTLDQWNDFPRFLEFTERLGAKDVGICKVQLPQEACLGVTSVDVNLENHKASHLSIAPQSNGTFRLETEEVDVVPATALALSSSPVTNSYTTDEYIDRYERLLGNEEGLQNVYYYVDMDAQTEEVRSKLGLPIESPIWPLQGDCLPNTNVSIPGIHWPYCYRSGPAFGASFTAHIEDYYLYSVSYLYESEKIWYAIAPRDRLALEEKLRTTNLSTYTTTCSQFLRHSPTLIPRSTLQEWGIAYTVVHQRPGEAVITFPRTYHQGFSVGPTVAEAINYADAGWNFDDYVDCKGGTCPPVHIRREMMHFRKDGEPQLEMREVGENELSDISKHESAKKRFTKRRVRESQTEKEQPRQSISRASGFRKRTSSNHDLQGRNKKNPRQSTTRTELVPFETFGRIPENTIQPQNLYKKLTEHLNNTDITTLRFLTRLFFAIASPDAFADLRETCSTVREQGTFPAPEYTNTVESTVKAIDTLDSAAFANRILRRNYLVLLVEHRHEREAHHKSQLSTRNPKSTRSKAQQSDGVQRQYAFGRPSSMALTDLMGEAYPDLKPPSRQREAEGTEYHKKLKALKTKLESGRNWHLLKQRFSAGILALVPVGGEYEIQNYE